MADDLHHRIGEMEGVPDGYRDRLRGLVDRAIHFAREVAARDAHEADSRRATSTLYHVASAVTLAWEASRVHARRGDARRLLLSRLVLDHRLKAGDPFAVQAGAAEERMADLLLSERPVAMREAAEIAGAGG